MTTSHRPVMVAHSVEFVFGAGVGIYGLGFDEGLGVGGVVEVGLGEGVADCVVAHV